MLQKTIKTENLQVLHVKKEGYKQNILILYLMNIFASIHFFGSVLIPFMEDYGGLTFTQMMTLQSIFMAGIFLWEIPTGTIADKYSRKISLNMGFVINIIAIMFYVMTPTFWMFALGEVIWAISVALHSGAYEAMLYDTLLELGQESKSQKHFARMKSIGLIAMSLGSISGSFIARYLGLKATMVYSTIPLGIVFLLSLLLKEPGMHKKSKKESPLTIFRKGFQKIQQSRSLQRIIADMVVLSMIGYFGIWLYQKRLMELGMDIKYFGLVQTSIIALEVIVMNSSEPLEKLLKSKKRVLTLSGIGIGTGFLITGLFPNIPMTLIGFVLATGFGMSYQVLSINYMNKHIPSEQRATILSTASMVRQIAITLANPLIGYGGDMNMALTLSILGLCGLLWAISSPLKETDLID